MRNLRTLRSNTAVTRAIRFLPVAVFLVVIRFLGFPVQAVQPPQDTSFSLEASLQETQTRYEAALRDSHSKYALYFEKAYKAYLVIPKASVVTSKPAIPGRIWVTHEVITPVKDTVKNIT